MTKIKPTTTLVFASIAMIWWTTHLAMFFHCYQDSDEPPSPPPQEHRHGCAINLYGLPRSCKDAVLPSLITNVIQINRHYYCDYYVHYFNKTFEPGGRSGLGGEIHPEDVLLLEPAVTAVHGHKNRSSPTKSHPLPRVQFVADSDEDFERERKENLRAIFQYKDPNQNNNTRILTFSGKALQRIIEGKHC